MIVSSYAELISWMYSCALSGCPFSAHSIIEVPQQFHTFGPQIGDSEQIGHQPIPVETKEGIECNDEIDIREQDKILQNRMSRNEIGDQNG